ncbi:MAG: ABC transporter ATP-binding protein [Cohaesibacteraceae bacterium]|nr:ABC transporter ATP-binding protein [Cohaesibacteraceae bacterium]PCH82524.1 MAG: peptide ABC transporter ATP-binding protein [Hyphomicrobiales bacterium]
MTNLIEITDLSVEFRGPKNGFFRKKSSPVHAVDNVSLNIVKGEALGLVGESGSGKTTLGRALLRLVEPTTGQVHMNSTDGKRNITSLDAKQLRKAWQNMQMVFQDPQSSLNPRMTVMDTIAESLLVNGIAKNIRDAKTRVVEVAESCGLSSDQLNRYPHAFSGGQRQRISIARALVTKPEFIICDEPVSALDVSIQAQILNLLCKLQEEMDLTLLFISHDLIVVAYICDRIAVMYLGNIIEIAPTKTLFNNPMHPYTEALISAIPSNNPDDITGETLLASDAPGSAGERKGCLFSPRCRYADGKKCSTIKPALTDTGDGRMVACHFAEKLSLTGFGNH